MSSEDISSNKSSGADRASNTVPVESLKLTGRPGCLAVTVIGTFLVLLVIWGGYTLIRQNQLIETFTVMTADPLPPLETLDANQNSWKEFQEKAQQFIDVSQPGNKILEVSKENVHGLIATHPGWADYRELIRIKSFDEASQSIVLDARIPIRRLTLSNFMGGNDLRYLVGEIKLAPKIRNDIFGFEITEINVPGKILPPGFLENFKQTDLMHHWYMRPESEVWLKKVKKAEIKGELLKLEIQN